MGGDGPRPAARRHRRTGDHHPVVAGPGSPAVRPADCRHRAEEVVNMTTTLRLRCPCGRNLADVIYNEHNPTWTHDKLVVRARPNVRMRDFRPWSEAMKTASDPLPKVDGMSTLDILRARVARKRALARGDANPPPEPPPLPPRGPRRPARPDLA